MEQLEKDPLWFKDAIVYQVHVKTFFDSDGDGMGDFKGLTSKLDYLCDLGVTAVWLLPFCPSPLRDDGYDISDYRSVHPAYGTLRDFKVFLREAHQRGIRVITELVVNHTSDQHPWFQRARRAKPGTRWRDYYVWSDNPDRYSEARIIFQDFESSNWSWDPVAKAYYWHRFYSHQPDLNYDNPHVQKAILGILDFWFSLGIDGVRLDAVPYLFEREGTNCENLPETHQFLKRLRARLDENFTNCMLLGEANQWPEDAVEYFGEGDECHMAFHFPLMPRLYIGLRLEDRFCIVDILEQTPAIPESCQWAIFLRNHDELTLEMVTDEERDYMYRTYANHSQMRINLGIRRRLAPLLGNHRRRVELMTGLLFSLPGTPVIYYGDEIGMGDNIFLGDRNGVRTPMQWCADRNAGFSKANPQQLYLPVIIDPEYHYEVVNVETQQRNTHSLLWWTKRLVAMRKRFKAFGRGTTEFLYPENSKILAFIRRYKDESLLVVANLSRFVQYAELDLSAFSGMVSVELFGQTRFPVIDDKPFFLTLGPHSFYWFSLEKAQVQEALWQPDEGRRRLPHLKVSGGWTTIFKGRAQIQLEEVLSEYLKKCRWFGGKTQDIRAVKIRDIISLRGTDSRILLLNVLSGAGDSQTYVLPVAYASSEKAETVIENPSSAVARIDTGRPQDNGILFDAVMDQSLCVALLETIVKRRVQKGQLGRLVGRPTKALSRLFKTGDTVPEPSVCKAEQSNTSILFGDRAILKLFRKLDSGINPDWEIGHFLTDAGFGHIPAVAGAIEYYTGKRARELEMVIGMLQGYVSNVGDAWAYTQDILGLYFESLLAKYPDLEKIVLHTRRDDIDFKAASQIVSPYFNFAQLLGQRTAQLHVTLASEKENVEFKPEPFSKVYQRALYQGMHTNALQVLRLVRKQKSKLAPSLRSEAEAVLKREAEILKRLGRIVQQKIEALRIRCHGDFHLGQVLYTGKDCVIIDFEGEPARPLTERRIKRSPLKDVAGMLRSFHYAVCVSLRQLTKKGFVCSEDMTYLESGALFWYEWVCFAFLTEYVHVAEQGGFLPPTLEQLQILLDAYLLDKALYELKYEMENRPKWVDIPLRGILHLIG